MGTAALSDRLSPERVRAALAVIEAVRLWHDHLSVYMAAVATILSEDDVNKSPRTGPYWDAVRAYASQKAPDEQRLRVALAHWDALP